MESLIKWIIGLSSKWYLMLKIINPIVWIQKFIGNKREKNSKWMVIIQVTSQHIKWAYIIVCLCLTSSNQVSDVKLNMLEVIGQIIKQGMVFNWAKHVVNIVKVNCEECQEMGKAM